MISGLVVHLSTEEEWARQALEAIASQPAIEPGERQQQRLPVVLAADDSHESQQLTDWLFDLPGVVHVDVVFVDFEDATANGVKEFER